MIETKEAFLYLFAGIGVVAFSGYIYSYVSYRFMSSTVRKYASSEPYKMVQKLRKECHALFFFTNRYCSFVRI